MRATPRTFGLLDAMILVSEAAGGLALQWVSTGGILEPGPNASRGSIFYSLIQRGMAGFWFIRIERTFPK